MRRIERTAEKSIEGRYSVRPDSHDISCPSNTCSVCLIEAQPFLERSDLRSEHLIRRTHNSHRRVYSDQGRG
jgi:hypothetical protein